MSNALTRASHALTLVEKRVIAAMVAQVDSRKGHSMHAHLAQFTKLKLHAIDYTETFDVDEKHAYEHLKKAADHLFERYIVIKQPVKKGEKITKFRWVSSVTYAEGEGFIELSFTPEVYPHLHALRREYTIYKLKNAAALRSTYSWRLYEIAQSWLALCKSGKSIKLQLCDLRLSLGVPDKYTWHDTKKRALDPAIKEISEQSGLEITYDVIKTGRSVTSLNLSIKEESQMNLI